jgi:hypothetical protein
MDKFLHYPDNGPPIPDGKVIIRFDVDPKIELPFATHIVEEYADAPVYIRARGWDLETDRWTIVRYAFSNVLSVTRVCNSAEHGMALRIWETAHPQSDWRDWQPSAKRPSARMVQ